MGDPQTNSGPCWSRATFSRIRTTETAGRPPYAAISSIPRTPATRLTEQDARPTPFPDSPIAASALPAPAATAPAAPAAAPKSILYLAYGSNLCAETFQGKRGIRPLSQINVSAPSLRLTFDLPGLPYAEPCFANTAPRKIPKVPGGGPPKLPPDLPHPPATGSPHFEGKTAPGDPVWTKGLIGVVYEVTPEDFARIVATEGGGASYADVLVPCLPLPPRVGVPEKPDWPELPKVFLAHTLLYAPPRMPGKPGGGEDGEGQGGNGDGEDDDGDGKCRMPAWMRRWAKRLVLPVPRPDQDYAQPSARYLRLIRDGAREHELPDEYQRYLWELKPYTITRLSQRIGMVLLTALFGPLFMLVVFASTLFADESGRIPRWLAVCMAVLLNVVWMTYDKVFKPVFGDGERTEKADQHEDRRRRASILSRRSAVIDEEKRLLGARETTG